MCVRRLSIIPADTLLSSEVLSDLTGPVSKIFETFPCAYTSKPCYSHGSRGLGLDRRLPKKYEEGAA